MAKKLGFSGEIIGAYENGDQSVTPYSGSYRGVATTTIASGGTVSTAIECGEGGCRCAVQTPAAFDGSALAFQVSMDGVTYVALRDGDGAYAPAATTSVGISLDPAVMYPWRYVKVSGGASQAQSAERTIKGVIRGM